MNKNDITTLLKKLESYWVQKKCPVLKKLRAGIEMEISGIQKFTGDHPTEVIDLYRWKNGIGSEIGTDPLGSLYLFELGIFLSIDEIILIQNEMSGDEFGWESTKLPLFEGGGGEYFLIDCDRTKDSFGQIFYHSIGAVEFKRIISIYDSLYSLFFTVYQCNIAETYRYDRETGILMINSEQSFNTGRKLNPRSAYWKLFE